MDKKELNRRLDKLCSIFVRCKEQRCFTCGKVLRYADRQAGHYIPRGVLGARWHIDNIHVQCYKCNVYRGGNLQAYRQRLFPKTLERLESMYESYKKGELPEPSYEEKKNLYNGLLRNLRDSHPKRMVRYSKWQEID